MGLGLSSFNVRGRTDASWCKIYERKDTVSERKWEEERSDTYQVQFGGKRKHTNQLVGTMKYAKTNGGWFVFES